MVAVSLDEAPPPLPCSKKRLTKVGDALAAGSPSSEDFEFYASALDVYDQRTAKLREVIDAVDWSDVLGREVALDVTARTKTLGTLVDKLRRQPDIKLPYIRDISGVRVVGDVQLTEQDRIGEHLRVLFDLPETALIDRRAQPESGYRALHVAVSWHGLPAEVQVRTELQAAWAEIYERQADLWGREMRYGLPPAPGPDGSNERRVELVSRLHEISLERIAPIEELRGDVAGLAAAIPKLEHDLLTMKKRRGQEAVREQSRRRAFLSQQRTQVLDLERRVEALVQDLKGQLLALSTWAEAVN